VADDLAIIVPVFNEEDNILPLAGQVARALANQPRPYELVFVDDASTDQTWARIGEAARTDARVRGLRHQSNAGQSAAFWTGLRSTGSELVATLDGDLQNDPADLPEMLAQLAQADLVCGVRLERCDSGLRRLSTRVARHARRLALGVDFRDTGCFLRVFRRQALEGVVPFNGWHRFLPILVHAAGRTVREMPVHHRPRTAGKSKYGVWNRLGRGLYDLVGVGWLLARRLRPVAILPLADAAAGPQRNCSSTDRKSSGTGASSRIR
jgi:dolichol-phosphate mannosyltransferase